jgi:O-succinylbenzoate synthase
VIMLDVLEHLHHPLSSLQKITRALVPGGLLLLKVPNVRHEYGLYPKLRGRTALGFGAHEHLNHFSRETLTEALRRSDLTVESWIGFIPLTGNGIVGRTARGLALAAGRCIAGTWANWSEYHLSLVCIARKTAGVTGKSPAQ